MTLQNSAVERTTWNGFQYRERQGDHGDPMMKKSALLFSTIPDIVAWNVPWPGDVLSVKRRYKLHTAEKDKRSFIDKWCGENGAERGHRRPPLRVVSNFARHSNDEKISASVFHASRNISVAWNVPWSGDVWAWRLKFRIARSSSMSTECLRWQRSGVAATTWVFALLQHLSILKREWKMVPNHKSGALSSIRMAYKRIYHFPSLQVLTQLSITLYWLHPPVSQRIQNSFICSTWAMQNSHLRLAVCKRFVFGHLFRSAGWLVFWRKQAHSTLLCALFRERYFNFTSARGRV